ncbi:beta-2 microglobulin precursor, partial [Clarias magur]
MNVLLSFIVLAVFCTSSFAKESPPEIKVYSQNPVVYGKKNVLICHISGFYPVYMDIKLLKNGDEIPNSEQFGLEFHSDGMFHQSKKASFTPDTDNKFTCRVKHMQNEMTVVW